MQQAGLTRVRGEVGAEGHTQYRLENQCNDCGDEFEVSGKKEIQRMEKSPQKNGHCDSQKNHVFLNYRVYNLFCQ